MASFGSISLRNGDRAFCEGGSQSGKSTLCAGAPEYPFADTLCGEWLARYPTGQLLIADTKPRFRAAYSANGMSDHRHYKNWDHGPVIPDSTRIDPYDIAGMERALRTCRIVIIQTDAADRDAAGVVACIEYFRRTVNKKHKRMIYIDECMDFYTQSGTPLKGTGNVILRCARAGAERNITSLLGAQRCKGLPPQLWELINKCYLFRMDMISDMERIAGVGAPVSLRENLALINANNRRRSEGKAELPTPVPGSFWPPEEDYLFIYWTKAARRKVWGPYHLIMQTDRKVNA